MSRYFMMCAPFAVILFLAAVVPSQGQTAAAAGVKEAEAEVVAAAGSRAVLECALRVEAAAARWRHEGGPPAPELRAEELAAPDGSLRARLVAERVAPRHAGLYTCGPANHQRLRLIVIGADAATAAGAGAGAGAGELFYYDVGHSIQLSCDVPNPDNTQIVWKKNGTLISELADVSGRAKFEGVGGAKLVIPVKTHEDDFGNYTCSVGSAARDWQVRGRPHSKLPANTNVVEGQKLKLQCRVIGKPYASVTWLYLNATGENATAPPVPALDALGGRGQVARSEQGVEGAVLLVEAAARGDAGTYYCAVGGEDQYNGHTELRVKDMYAALWPFLGICAEVLVLCAIILVYEKRRTKPELDDSDTDNHDQKKS